MRIWATVFGLIFLLLASCSQKRICAAYQSSFIYDKESLRKKFSYFEADSTPKIFLAASKSKYLIAVPESYRKKYQRLQIVDMTPVYPVKPDSLKEKKDLLAETDSLLTEELMQDSISVAKEPDESGLVMKSPDFKITKTKEKYNHDQQYYLWFFRKNLILPDIRYHLNKKSSGVQPADDAAPAKPEKAKAPAEKKRSSLISPSLRNRIKTDSVSRPNRN